MTISEKKVGVFNYTLKDSHGVVIDSSEGKSPLAYIHGMRNLIPGMEKALEGKQAGDKFEATVSPEEGYGEINDKLINEVPLANFPDKDQVEVGVQFQANTPEGTRIATVVKVEGETVTVDFNHQLAGETLHFAIEVVEVRDATEEEIAHGHVHTNGECEK